MENKEILKQVFIGMVLAVCSFFITFVACVLLSIIMP